MAELDERTGLEILDEETCWRLLRSKSVGRLAVSIANDPEIFPLNFAVDGRSIVFNTLPGVKLAAAILGRGVAFEVDDLSEESRQGWSVIVHGKASEIEGTDQLLRAEGLGIVPWAHSEKLRFLRIEIDRISGRRVPSL